MLAIVATYAVFTATQADEAGGAEIVVQAKDKEKAKDKDLKKEKGKKGKDKKSKDEEEDTPTSGGISGGEAALLALGGGAVFVGGGLLARRIFWRPASTEGGSPAQSREEGGPEGDGSGDQ